MVHRLLSSSRVELVEVRSCWIIVRSILFPNYTNSRILVCTEDIWAESYRLDIRDIYYIPFTRPKMDPTAQLDLSKLSDADKKELNQFLTNEAQKSNIQQSK